MVSLFSNTFRGFTILVWIFLAALQYNNPDPKIWISTYLTVSLLYSTEWFSFFKDPGRKILIAGLSKAIGAGYFIWGIYAFMEDSKSDFDSRTFRESIGLGLSALWLFILPFFQRKRNYKYEN